MVAVGLAVELKKYKHLQFAVVVVHALDQVKKKNQFVIYFNTCVDTCVCNSGSTGVNCETFTCAGIAATDTANVCSGRGSCSGTFFLLYKLILIFFFKKYKIGPNYCACNTGYGGGICQLFVCNNILSNSSSVCSSAGTCTAPNTCTCTTGCNIGSNCEIEYCNTKASLSYVQDSNFRYCCCKFKNM